MKVLNLYAGIGGNRKLWPEYIKIKGVIHKLEVTAVEINEDIANVYKALFPKDNVIVGDAHKYLLEHFKEFDFIWSSPPCPTHSAFKKIWAKTGQQKTVYPDMSLYQEIILLSHFFKGKFCIENVVGYYEPLITPQCCGRHYFWANFFIVNKSFQTMDIRYGKTEDLEKKYNIDLSSFKISDKRHLLRNCVDPQLSEHLFNCAFKEKQQTLII